MANHNPPTNGFDKRPQDRCKTGSKPKNLPAFRKMSVSLLSEIAVDKNGNPILWNGQKITNAELVARSLMTDKKYMQTILEYAYGKVTEKLELSGDAKIVVKVVDDAS